MRICDCLVMIRNVGIKLLGQRYVKRNNFWPYINTSKGRKIVWGWQLVEAEYKIKNNWLDTKIFYNCIW